MPKRMTVTEKWKDEWFINLSPQAKVIWEYMRDNCDLSGVWEVNVELMRFQVKFSSQVDVWKHLMELNEVAKKLGMEDRVEWFGDKKRVWLVNFIKVQYGVLSEKSSTHRGVIKVIIQNSFLKGLPKGYLTLIGVVKDKAISKDIKKENLTTVGEERANEALQKALSSALWLENIMTANGIAKKDLEKWLHKYSASIAQDPIPNFSPSVFQKMFTGWLPNQLKNGKSLPETDAKQTNSSYRLKTIS